MRPTRPSKRTLKAAGQIRIIGGRWRGRKLPVLDLEGLRPTTDRLKETLFNWLQFECAGARVLDAFAGAGSLGMEALSRGAAYAVFVERSAPAAAQLSDNLRRLEAETISEVHKGDIQSYLKTPQIPYDLVFLDPPFHQNLLAQVIPQLVSANALSNGSWVYVESEHPLPYETPENWRLHREKLAGQVCCRLYHVQ
ncbi:16S rRNA (guanine(966)-N(2))-methyltransferase RsmD [Aliidiomarina halalkaliphila]|uniref:Ribosomal RNA small subunit methyltransferase D n=1 Tax=Aliidiomarina halalkaliphila TaxID=2593535 RepID=A0A552X1P5_9GAMM|nr:16S rRNA (guanine(966)-N(2))-methyltransferase RsmD [Aliidiomarina halalkaliphila]TRW48968.1 16S rRNA (guanine(966)-N(2))-methyltransferase RsmD [Aliidiomarina halalkaliphila]